MPTYQYECVECGAITEVFQSMSEPTRRKLRKTDDPQCSCNDKVTRLIGTGAGVIFKGSGFYETDYRSDSYKKAAKAEKEAGKPKKDGKADGKSESKSDSGSKKSESKTTTESKTKKAESSD